MNPAEEAVVRHALGRGYIQQGHLTQARQEQAARQQRGQPSDLLPLLARFLNPAQVQELRQVYLSATQSGVLPPQATHTGFQTHPSVHPSQVGYQTRPASPSGSHSHISLQNMPESGEKTIQLQGGPTPDGVTHSFMPPGVGSAPPASVHLGVPSYQAPVTAAGQFSPAGAYGSTSAFGGSMSGVEGRAGNRLPVAGDQIGDYSVIRELARGGMGVVYEATDVNLGRRVAIKLLLSQDLSDDDVLVQRFLTEARELSNLSHPNIASVYGASRDANGRHYMAMEFLEGEELKDWIVRDGSIAAPKAAEVVLKLARALSHAHKAGVLHRDIKPSNVIVTPQGEPKLVDFGLARNVADERERLTRTGEIMGTPAYMPPEQAGGEKSRVGPLADVYSLGATLYHMLAGQPPFRGTSVMNLINKVLSEEPAPPSSHNAEIPKALEAICLKAMEKEVEERYESAAALAEDLERFLGPRGEVSAKARGPVGRALRWAKRKGAVMVGGAFALLGVAVAVAAILIPDGAPPIPPVTPTLTLPTPVASPSPEKALLSRLVLSGETFAAQESIQVYRAWGLEAKPQGLTLRSNRGEGPDLILPFQFQGRRLRLRAKLKVHYLTRGTSFLVRLIGADKVHVNSKPGGPPIFEARLDSRVQKVSHEHGWTLRWAEEGRLRGSAVDFAFLERKHSGPFEIELNVEFTRQGATLSVGDGLKTQVPCRLASGEYRLQLVFAPFSYRPDDQTKALSYRLPTPDAAKARWNLKSPGLARVLVQEISLEAEGAGSLGWRIEEGDWATVGALGRRAAAPNADPTPIAAELAELSTSGFPLVRNESIFLRAALSARANKAQEAQTQFAQFYRANSLERTRSDFQRGRVRWYQDTFSGLDEPGRIAFAGGYAQFFQIRDEGAALLAASKRFHPLTPLKEGKRGKPLNASEALFCLLLAKDKGSEPDPLQLGTAYLFHGDLEAATRILVPLAEAGGEFNATLFGGMAAYLSRDYVTAHALWSRAHNENSKIFRQNPWAFRWQRCSRLLGK